MTCAGLPPVLLQVPAREVLRCDAEAMAQRLAKPACRARCRSGPASHSVSRCWPGCCREAMAALIEAGAFIQEVTTAAARELTTPPGWTTPPRVDDTAG